MSTDAKAFLELCHELRTRYGATLVVCGELRAEFGPAPMPASPRQAAPTFERRLTEEQRAEALRIEREKELSRV